ncbi:MAG: tetratricopeptide repeat protein [Pyrinomonadaceae bacterium]
MAAKKKNPRTIRVFIASPGDLAVERAAFKEVIDELNGGFGDGAGVVFEALGWEDTLATTGRRSQSVINQDVDRCDVFILAMHRRWGQDAPDSPYSSYTEEEFQLAYERWKNKKAPEIFVFFKHIDPGQMADAGPQLQKVLDFRRQLEETRQVLYHGFADESEFRKEVNKHLRAFAKGELPKADAPLERIILPMETLVAVEKERKEKEAALAKAEAEHKVAEAAVARAEELALDLAESASKAALEGRVEEARQDFAKATNGTTNLRVLYLASQFYFRAGDLTAAEEILERSLAISGRDSETADTAAVLGNLGLIYQTRGELDRAEEMHKKSLAIAEKLCREEYMASQYGNLGLIYETRGELDLAEEMHKKALAINEKLGREEGMSANHGNLGLIYRTRGEMDRAEDMLKKSLAIHKKLGNQEGIAITYGNLGLIYQIRGEIDRAEKMVKKSLAINEKLGRLEGMANQYANLGSVAEDRGDLDGARALLAKSRDLFSKVGMPHKVKELQGWLDELPES